VSERDAFMRTIIAEPKSDVPRLVFADWLQEHGENARAELIRLQCQLYAMGVGVEREFDASPSGIDASVEKLVSEARVIDRESASILQDREQELLQIGFEEGWNDFPGYLREWWFCRGFVERASSAMDDWRDFGHSICCDYPLVRVEIYDREPFKIMGVWSVMFRPGDPAYYELEGISAPSREAVISLVSDWHIAWARAQNA
jgi:uncharacterized protein (TIGR02996 family)